MSIKHVLWVVPKYTFPKSDGARAASDSLVQSFIKTGHNLDVLSLVDNNQKDISEYEENWSAHRVFLLSRPAPKSKIEKIAYWLKSFFLSPLSPLTLSYFRDKNVIQEVRSCIDLNKYDAIILDGLHGYAAIEGLLENCKGKVIYRAHNVEQDLWSSAAEKTSNVLVSIFYKFQGLLMGKFENKLISISDSTWTICDEDQERFKQEVPLANYITVPVGMDFKTYKERVNIDSVLNLFFLGRLDWAPNKEGLRWFLDEVWPTLSKNRPDIILNIGGSGNGEWLRPYLGSDHLIFHGLIDDLSLVYSQMDLAIMPIFFGSGTRIKVIEAACFGLPMISSKMGIQGSGLSDDHYFHAESSVDWISTLSHIKKDELGSKSYKAWSSLKNILDYQAISELINRSL